MRLGIILAVLYKLNTRAPVTLKDQAAIIAASMSHFILEWPSHREGMLLAFVFVGHDSDKAFLPCRTDIKITPHDDQHIGAGMFDHTVITFVVECAIFLAGLWVYATFAPMATKTGYKTHRNRLMGIVLFLIGAQAHFSFGS